MRAFIIISSFWSVLLTWETVRADYPPDIYAICEVRMKSGKVLEGIIQLSDIGECGYHPNGFVRFYDGKPFPDLFSLLGEYRFDNTGQVYFVVNQTIGCEEFNTVIDSTTTDTYILSETTKKYKYKLTNSFEIYTDLEITGRPQADSSITINVEDVETFKFIYNPSSKWTELISKRQKGLGDDMKKNPDNWSPDIFEPLWLHAMTELEKCHSNKMFKQ